MQPPDGWLPFGTHAALLVVPLMEFSDEEGEDGLPLWERHYYGAEECRCEFPAD